MVARCCCMVSRCYHGGLLTTCARCYCNTALFSSSPLPPSPQFPSGHSQRQTLLMRQAVSSCHFSNLRLFSSFTAPCVFKWKTSVQLSPLLSSGLRYCGQAKNVRDGCGYRLNALRFLCLNGKRPAAVLEANGVKRTAKAQTRSRCSFGFQFKEPQFLIAIRHSRVLWPFGADSGADSLISRFHPCNTGM